MTCECHKINWLARVRNKDKKYTMVDGTLLENGVDCQDKINDGEMEMDTYFSVCKYRPGAEGSLFPDEVYQDLMKEYQDIQEDTSQKRVDIPLICKTAMPAASQAALTHPTKLPKTAMAAASQAAPQPEPEPEEPELSCSEATEAYMYGNSDKEVEVMDIPLICQYQLEWTSLGTTHSEADIAEHS
jgi:hypothetical protein